MTDISEDLKRFIEIKSQEGIKFSEEGIENIREMEMEEGKGYTRVVHKEGSSTISRSWFESGTISYKHYHLHKEIFYCLKGEMILIVEGVDDKDVDRHSIKEGDVLILEGRASHTAYFPEYTVLLIIEYPLK